MLLRPIQPRLWHTVHMHEIDQFWFQRFLLGLSGDSANDFFFAIGPFFELRALVFTHSDPKLHRIFFVADWYRFYFLENNFSIFFAGGDSLFVVLGTFEPFSIGNFVFYVGRTPQLDSFGTCNRATAAQPAPAFDSGRHSRFFVWGMLVIALVAKTTSGLLPGTIAVVGVQRARSHSVHVIQTQSIKVVFFLSLRNLFFFKSQNLRKWIS